MSGSSFSKQEEYVKVFTENEEQIFHTDMIESLVVVENFVRKRLELASLTGGSSEKQETSPVALLCTDNDSKNENVTYQISLGGDSAPFAADIVTQLLLMAGVSKKNIGNARHSSSSKASKDKAVERVITFSVSKENQLDIPLKFSQFVQELEQEGELFTRLLKANKILEQYSGEGITNRLRIFPVRSSNSEGLTFLCQLETNNPSLINKLSSSYPCRNEGINMQFTVPTGNMNKFLQEIESLVLQVDFSTGLPPGGFTDKVKNSNSTPSSPFF